MNNIYNEDSIKSLTAREGVRSSVGMYISNNGTEGMHHLLTEIVSNAMDEAAAGFGKEIIIKINSQENSASVIDQGRGIPFRKNHEDKYAIVEMCTNLHSGGKFEGQGNYKSALGLHGVGATVTQALSSYFHIKSVREDGTCDFYVIDGYYEDPDIEDGKNKKTGSIVEFIPDTKIFGNIKWDKNRICEELQLHALLNNNIKFTLNWDDEQPISYIYRNGIKDMLEIKGEGEKKLTDPVIFSTVINKGCDNECAVDFGFQYIDRQGEYIYSFVNGGYTEKDGTHVTGWKSSYTSFINNKARQLKLLQDKDSNFEGTTVRKGLLLVLSIKMNERPMFAEQTKQTLNSAPARGYCSKAVGQMTMNDKVAEQIIKKILVEKKAEDAAQRKRDAEANVARGGKSMNYLKDMPEKLADSDSHQDAEIFFCEGEI